MCEYEWTNLKIHNKVKCTCFNCFDRKSLRMMLEFNVNNNNNNN